MNNNRIISIAIVASVAAGIVVFVQQQDLGEPTIEPGIVYNTRNATLIELPDSGVGYSYPSILEDGGVQYLITDQAPCVRAKQDAGMCWRVSLDGGQQFFGFNNRFPVQNMHPSSTLCQPVACLVVFGQNDMQDQVVTIERQRANRN